MVKWSEREKETSYLTPPKDLLNLLASFVGYWMGDGDDWVMRMTGMTSWE